jgi:transaldolase
LKRGTNADIGRKNFFGIAYNITLCAETRAKEDDHSMKFFIDTANIDEIKEANAMGMVDGVTTNPTLIAREKGEFKDIIAEICRIVDGPISAEVISLATDGMVDEARVLAKIHDNIVVKIPMTTDGLKAVRILAAEGIHTNVTLVFSALQALMAAKAGASYVSPFVGRLDDLSQEGMQLIEQVADIYSNYAYDTEIIVASIRNPMHVLDAALIGADIATIPFNVLKKLAAHPLTDKGIDAFLNDWKKKDH